MEEEHRRFECLICFDEAREPIVTPCGHLYCWPCIYSWLQQNRQSYTCPACNSGISMQSIIPLYTKENEVLANQTMPPRPPPQRSEPVRNSSYNPFRNLGEDFGYAGPGEGVSVFAGFGFFPTIQSLLATSEYSVGDALNPHVDTVSQKEATAVCVLCLFALLTFVFLV